MIKDIFFMLKMFGLTILITLAMQVHIGDKSVEDHFHGWVRTSIVVDYLEEAIEGGARLFHVGYQKADTQVRSIVGKMSRKHEKRDKGFNLGLKRYDDTDGGSRTLRSRLPSSTTKEL